MSTLLEKNGEPIMGSAEQLRAVRRAKYNPLRTLGPQTLARALDNFEYGYLREAALLFDVIAERDDTLKSVKPKREKEVSQLDFQIMPVGAKDATYEAHKQVLEDFWKNVRAVNAYDRNEKGGFKRLVRQMMSSASNRYAVHHIVWRPGVNGLRATFEFVPLWLFENTTGSLRYLRDPYASEGETMADEEWMVTTGDGLMISCSIGYHAKRSTYNDWLIFSEKFSMPGVLGRTSAAKGTPEGNMMRDAVAAFGHDWNGVLYGDDGQHKEPIQLIKADGNPAAMPMPAIIERVDRKFAALYRGADLSTMSSQGGEGTGASLQGKEKEILLRDDAEVITETLERVSRQVIQWYFGWNVEPAARLEMLVPTDEDGQFLLEASTKLAEMGAPVSMESTMSRLSIQAADEDETILGAGKAKEEKAEAVANSKFAAIKARRSGHEADHAEEEVFEKASRRLLDLARQQDMQPVAERMQELLDITDEEEFTAALKKLNEDLPGYVGETGDSEGIWAAIYASALANGLGEEDARDDIANGDKPGHAFRGNQWSDAAGNKKKGTFKEWVARVRKGLSREGNTKDRSRDQFGKRLKGRPLSADDNEERLSNAVNYALRKKQGVHGAAHHAELGVIDLPWGTPGDTYNDFKHGKGLSHILAKHGEADVRLLPKVLSRGTVESHGDPTKRHIRLRDPRFSPEDPSGILVEAVLVKTKASKSWVLTNYTKNK